MFCRRDATGNGEHGGAESRKQKQFISKSWQKGKVETRLHSCQFSRTAAYLQSSVMFHIQYTLCAPSGLGGSNFVCWFVVRSSPCGSPWSALSTLHLANVGRFACTWRLRKLPVYASNCNELCFWYVGRPKRTQPPPPTPPRLRPTFMHYACDEVAEETRNQCANTATYYKIRLERIPWFLISSGFSFYNFFFFLLRFSPQHEILKFNNVHSSEQSQRAETEKLNRPIQLSGHSPIRPYAWASLTHRLNQCDPSCKLAALFNHTHTHLHTPSTHSHTHEA